MVQNEGMMVGPSAGGAMKARSHTENDEFRTKHNNICTKNSGILD